MFNRSRSYQDQSYHTRTEMTPEGILKVKAFNVESEVCNYLEDCYYIEQRLKEKEQKKRYFKDYLHRLTPDKRAYLYKRYVHGLEVTVNESIEHDTMAEILEIEDAVAYMNGREPDKLMRIEDGTELEFDELLDVLGV
ncbi:hypothetical protein [Alkalibacterium gilvum]|uniref:hypothetical protein n=1 Tax=Alkalibacterium gilvum TaxID=1130080 RepID=UPI003F8EBFA5